MADERWNDWTTPFCLTQPNGGRLIPLSARAGGQSRWLSGAVVDRYRETKQMVQIRHQTKSLKCLRRKVKNA